MDFHKKMDFHWFDSSTSIWIHLRVLWIYFTSLMGVHYLRLTPMLMSGVNDVKGTESYLCYYKIM